MKKIKALQIGLGPLGVKIYNYIQQRPNIETVGAVDINPALVGKDFGTIVDNETNGLIVTSDLKDCIENTAPDVIILSTVSSFEKVAAHLEHIVPHGLPVVSTCEELSYPWQTSPEIAEKVDNLCKKHNVAVVGTGVNPGFLMDTLPTLLTGVCQDVEYVEVNRYQNAAFRRIPFQQKIGAGLDLDAFEQKKADGSLRHVGLTESMQFIASRMGWTLDKTEDIIEPVMAESPENSGYKEINPGEALGVMQTGRAYQDGKLKIKLQFKAAVGNPESYDEVYIKGTPDIRSKIEGGVNGDIATCAIVLNTIPQVMRSTSGLKTMADIAIPSYF